MVCPFAHKNQGLNKSPSHQRVNHMDCPSREKAEHLLQDGKAEFSSKSSFWGDSGTPLRPARLRVNVNPGLIISLLYSRRVFPSNSDEPEPNPGTTYQ